MISFTTKGSRVEPNMMGKKKKKVNEVIPNDILLYLEI